ncbi:MAG: hypothetical protein IPH13_20850 [Planctomycetes bacterium]|nr:hypothetical protein [Planctomycetota bacterium]
MIYAVRGQYVPAWIIEHQIESQSPRDSRRDGHRDSARDDREMGTGRYLTGERRDVVDADERTSEGGGPRALLRDSDGSQWLRHRRIETSRVYYSERAEW